MKQIALALCLLAAAPPLAAQAADPADAAWVRGDVDAAARLYEQRLAQDSTDLRALHRVALAKAWNDRFDESLALFDRLLRLSPGNVDARLDRANVLGWAGRNDAAIEAAGQVLDAHPGDTRALDAVARFSSWAGRYAEAVSAYGDVLALDPDNLEARKGLARVAAWSGRLRESERRWRDVLSAEPQDVDALVGLATNLRWQGRTGAALDVLERAEAVAPGNRDVQKQRRWLDAAAGPRLVPDYLYESDSDGNRAGTFRVTGSWLAAGAVGLSLSADTRDFDGPDVAGRRSTRSAELALSLGLGRGWTVTGGGGVRDGVDAGQAPIALWRAGVSTPGDLPVAASLTGSRSAFDYTALLAENNVTVDEVALDVVARTFAQRLRIGLRGGYARFDAADSNDRWLASARLDYRATKALTVGLDARAFGFAEDVSSGYWDPGAYGVVAAPVRLSLDGGRLFAHVELAPGYQAIDYRTSTVQNAALRAVAGTGIRFGPGREVGVSGIVANSGVHRVSPAPESDYEYRALRIYFAWSLR